MRLDRLADALDGPRLLGDPTAEVTSVVHDLADVRAGSLFCCVPGSRVDGHDLAPEALSRGAAALVVEHELPDKAPQLVVRSTRAAMGPVAAELHGHPSRRLVVCGVTGTNGKTTTVAFLTAMLEAGGLPTLTIGSLSPRQPGRPPNTPEAPELQAQLAAAVDAGKQAVAMEVSSIGLEQHRLDGTWFSVGVFTNLTQDHLEFHGDMESYYRAKRSLFTAERIGSAAVNRDDEWGRRLLGELEGAPFPVTTFSVEGEELPVSLAGVHNQSNAQAALAAALAVGVDRNAALAGLATVETVPGRMETVHAGQDFAALVDYAHTPDALERALQAARDLAGGNKVVVVFGCGGDRDQGKRPLMGRIATELADVAVLTSDNPRSEDPLAIIDEVRAGAGDGLMVEADRATAIRVAVEHAGPGDVVLVTGKGHETGQEAGGLTIPFDDREELAAAIRETSR